MSELSGLERFTHLIPPDDDPSSTLILEWRRLWRFGSFYFRLGPDFATIKDSRPSRDFRSITLFSQETRLLRDASSPSNRADLDKKYGCNLVTTLIDNEILVQIGLVVFVLPYRIKVWPIPYLGI